MAAFGYLQVVLLFQLIVALRSFLLLVGAVDHVVGGDEGWAMDVDYRAWVKDRQFFVGDTLVFNYRKGDHNVAKVDESGFSSCTVPTNAEVSGTGKDVVMLSVAGEEWYICGLPSHCSVGDQKLAITVLLSAVPSTMPPPPQMSMAVPPPYSSIGLSHREGAAGSYVAAMFIMLVAMVL